MCTWFQEKRAEKLPLSRNIVQQKALNYTCVLGTDDFKASKGWLNCFKAWHNIVSKVLCGKLASADAKSAFAWLLSNSSSLIKDYTMSDTYNADKTRFF